MQQAFHIPEIVHDITKFLRFRDRKACILVCRQWYDAFLPSVWERISKPPRNYIDIDPEGEKPTKDQMYSIRKYGHLIREYHLQTVIMDEDPILLLNNLVVLQITYPRDYLGLNNERISQVIRQNHSLTSIKSDYICLLLSNSILQAMIDSPSLRSLTMERCHYFPPPVDLSSLVWRVCSRLHTAVLNMDLYPKVVPTLDREKNCLRDLTLYGMDGQDSLSQLRLLEECPELRRINWKVQEHRGYPIKEFSALLDSSTWRKLESLEVNGANLSRETLNKVLGSMKYAVHLGLRNTMFGPESLKRLVQSGALRFTQSMELKKCFAVTSPMVQQILTSCPLLEIFSANGLSSIEILEDVMDNSSFTTSTGKRPKYPWVCLGLKTLEVGIVIQYPPGRRKDLYRYNMLVMEQLSKLKFLTQLGLSAVDRKVIPLQKYVFEDSDDTLQFRCGLGLEHLRTMIRLRKFTFEDHQYLAEEELMWMRRNWPNIRRIEGPFHNDPDFKQQAKEWFYERAIELIG